jgi:hypothetical protein
MPAKGRKLEKDLTPVVKKWILASDPKAWIYKAHDASTRGIPDIHATAYSSSIWIEAKINHELNGLQRYNLQKIKAGGGYGFVLKGYMICDVDDFDSDTQYPIPDRCHDIRSVSLVKVLEYYDENRNRIR